MHARGAFGARTGRRAFLPRDARGCVLWMRADMGVTKDGSNNVSAVTDRSGRAATIAQGTAARQPLWVASGSNGLPTFRGNADAHRGLAVSGLTISGTMSLAVVLTKSSLALTYHWRGAGDAASCIIANFSGSSIEWFSGGGTDRQTFVTTPTAGPHVLIVTQTDGASLKGYYDGALAFSATPTAVITAPGVIGADGAYTNGGDGDYSEAVVSSVAWTAAEVGRVYRALRARYASP